MAGDRRGGGAVRIDLRSQRGICSGQFCLRASDNSRAAVGRATGRSVGLSAAGSDRAGESVSQRDCGCYGGNS